MFPSLGLHISIPRLAASFVIGLVFFVPLQESLRHGHQAFEWQLCGKRKHVSSHHTFYTTIVCRNDEWRKLRLRNRESERVPIFGRAIPHWRNMDRVAKKTLGKEQSNQYCVPRSHNFGPLSHSSRYKGAKREKKNYNPTRIWLYPTLETYLP